MTDIIARLEKTIAKRKRGSRKSSYVAKLFARGPEKIAQKFGEESVEAVVAALAEDDEALVGEAADTLFHLLILLAQRDIPFDAVLAELARREGISGLDEKASRGD